MEDSLKKKIQKLLALQESAAKIGSIEEAANATEKIRALLMKHNLDLYSIQKEGKEEEIEQSMLYPEELSPKTEGDWVKYLTHVIARHNMCEAIGTGRARGIMYIIGKPSNVEIVHYLIEQLINRIRPMGRKAFTEYNGFEKRNTFLRGYYRGAVKGIDYQLDLAGARERNHAEQDRKQSLIGTTALMTQHMLARNKQEIEAYLKKNFKIKLGRTSSLSSSSGRAQGFEAGKSMNINKGLGSSGPKATKFLD